MTHPTSGPELHRPAGADDSGRTLAIVSLVFGLCGLSVLPLLGSVVAVVTGHLARRRLAATGGDGHGFATAGLWLGYVALVLAVVVIGGLLAVVVVRTESA